MVVVQTTTPTTAVAKLIAKRNAHTDTDYVQDDGKCKGREKTERQQCC